MKRDASGFVLLVSCVMLCASGCAKKELLKQDEGMAPAAASTITAPVKTEVVAPEPVRQSTPKESAAMEPSKASAQAEALQAALQNIYFDFDSFKLSEAARATLAKNAGFLKKDAAEKVRIEGNCDERGSDEYNIALGERRATAALDYLVTLGVPANRLSVTSYGKEKPVDPGHDEAAWAKNRRDGFVVVTK